MIDRLILSAVLSTVGFNGLFPEPPTPLTLKQKAKMKSVSAVCERKGKQSKTVKQMCERWKEQRND
jgi:hypothetical protein